MRMKQKFVGHVSTYWRGIIIW